ncbi:MAG: DUF4197 domain-containing protein [Desulfatibacillum sp.]|nr:DUF4197 domain-containing protein [Desulfatibacillum sp.]
MKKSITHLAIVLASLVFFAGIISPALGGWTDSLKKVFSSGAGASSEASSQPAAGDSGANLSDSEMNSGIKEALHQAVNTAIASLGQENGYLGNDLVKIAMPEKLTRAESLLRTVGQGKLVDQFVESMNRAAEKAVPKTTGILGKAVTSMSLEDAAKILQGEDNAATQYFEQKTREELFAEIKPVVEEATDTAMVTSYYKNMMGKVGTSLPLLQSYSPDLDQYVTDKALDGLFVIMAQEEKKIRENPAARTTDLLKKVFGYFGG